MNFFMRILIIFTAFISANVVYAEYIVYKNQDNISIPITNSDEYRAIYAILMTYQWPMIVGAAPSIPLEELREITASSPYAEEVFLRKKLKSISPHYDLVYVPTILYELFVIIYNYSRPIASLKKLSDIMKAGYDGLMGDDMRRIIADPASTVQDLYNIYTEKNFFPEAFKSHYVVNNALLNYLFHFDKENQNAAFIMRKHLDAIIKNTAIYVPGDANSSNYLKQYSILKKFVNFENEMHKLNLGFLYRGGRSQTIYIVGGQLGGIKQPIEIYFMASAGKIDPTFQELLEAYKQKKSVGVFQWALERQLGKQPLVATQIPLGSVSYGNTLLSGFYHDQAACPAYYFAKEDRSGYALAIDKRSYLRGNLKTLFNLSLLNTIVGLVSRGEFFHSRSVSYATPSFFEYINTLSNPLINVEGIAEEINDKAGLLVRPGDPLQKAYELSSYIEQYAYILKAPNKLGGFYPQKDILQNYIKTQHEVTEMLKAMRIIKKYLYKKVSAMQVSMPEDMDIEEIEE